jgi:hypothetical protein
MDRVAVEYPAAHLIPKEITATIEAASGALSPDDLAILRAIKGSSAGRQQPLANRSAGLSARHAQGGRCQAH